MKVFLIILSVLAIIIAVILSLSAEFTIVFENGWSTKLRFLFIEKDIELSRILYFVLFPEKAAQEVKEESKAKKEEKAEEKQEEIPAEPAVEAEPEESKAEETESKQSLERTVESNIKQKNKKDKKNFIQKIIDEDGVVGIMLLVSNMVQTASKAVTTLIKGLHIYSLYVKMIIGGGDAADIAQKYGSVCSWYYPLKGFVLNSMKVDMYDDYVQPDFIAPCSEYEFQLIVSVNVALLLRVALRAGRVFLVNLIKNK